MATMKKDKKVKMKENVVIPIEGGGGVENVITLIKICSVSLKK